MEFYQMTLNDWMEMKEALDREFRLQQASFIKAGYLLRQIEKTKAYEMDGFKSLAEWAYDRYKLSPSTVSKYKHINEAFSLGGNSDQLDPKYIGYGLSKLTDMLALPEKDLDQLSPDMPRADIRALKAFNKEVGELPEEPTDLDKVVKLFWEKHPDEIEEILHQQAFSLDRFKECVIPSGNRTFVNGTAGYYAIFNEQTVKYRKGRGEWIFVTWEEFMEASRPYMVEEKHEEPAEEDPVLDPGVEVDHVHTGSDIPDSEAEESQGSGVTQDPAEDREPVKEGEEIEGTAVELPGASEDADPADAGSSMESGSGPARSGSGQTLEDVESGPDHSEHKEPDSEGSLPGEDDHESVLLAPAQLADAESEAGEDAEEPGNLSDSMNEPEDEEEKVSPAQLAAISRAKIYYKNLMSAMDAGAWQRALSSCESLQKALREVVGK